MPVQTVIQLRKGTAQQWLTANPILSLGEPGLETDTAFVKYGDGVTAWVDLPYGSTNTLKIKVQNATGSTIAKGSAVYVAGANGDNPLVALADADTEATSSKTLGLVIADIANGAQGYVVQYGPLTGVNTSAATIGQSVWLSSTAGGWVYGAPPAARHGVYLGVVTRVHAESGVISVKVQNGYELGELHDVNFVIPPVSGNTIVFDEESQQWLPGDAGSIGAAYSSHTHSIGQVTGLQDALNAASAGSLHPFLLMGA